MWVCVNVYIIDGIEILVSMVTEIVKITFKSGFSDNLKLLN